MAETLLQKAQRLGIKPAGSPVVSSPSAPALPNSGGETLAQKAQRLGIKPANPPVIPPAKEGLAKRATRAIIGAPLTMAARPFQAAAGLGQALGGEYDPDAIDAATKRITGGLVAPVPRTNADLKKEGGRAIQTVAFGLPGVTSAGAVFGAGASLEQGNDLLSLPTAVQTIGGAVGGKVLGIVGRPLLNAAGKVVGRITPRVIQDVAAQGAKALEEFAARNKILPEVLSKYINAGAEGVEKIANAPFKGAKNLLGKAIPAENTANRVARLNPSDAAKFKQMTGKTHGEYLVETGNVYAPEKIAENEYKKFLASKQSVDDALATLDGQFQDDSVKAAIDELLARETRINFQGGDSARINQLASKYNKQGLNMSEINEVKRLFERNNRLDYLKANVPESIEKANRVDDAIREWQFNQAEKLGLKNLPDLNKQTQASKFLVNALGKTARRAEGNNAINLTDWILLSGGSPETLAGFFAKRVFGNKSAQAAFSRFVSPKAPVEPILPVYGGKSGVPALIPGRDYSVPIEMRGPALNLPNEGPAALIRRSNMAAENQRLLPAPASRPTGLPTIRLPKNAGQNTYTPPDSEFNSRFFRKKKGK